jgi:ABC-type sugar transport system substrate-binding protein
MALGAVNAAEQAGKLKGLTIVAFDNLSEVRKPILDGTIAGSIEQFPDWMGETAVRVAHELKTTGRLTKTDLRSPLEMISAESLKTKDVKPVGDR